MLWTRCYVRLRYVSDILPINLTLVRFCCHPRRYECGQLQIVLLYHCKVAISVDVNLCKLRIIRSHPRLFQELRGAVIIGECEWIPGL